MRHSKHEHDFWQNITNLTLKDWRIKLVEGAAGNLSECTVHVYLIDMETGWMVAGSLSPEGVKNTISDVTSFIEAVEKGTKPSDIAGGAVRHCAKIQAAQDSKEAIVAINLSIAAMSETRSWQLAINQTGSFEGHWVYLCYGMEKSGDLYARPAFLSIPGEARNALLNPLMLDAIVAQVLEQDVGNPNTSVGQRLRAGGGAKLAPKFRR